jgi:periplasmic protein TonB
MAMALRLAEVETLNLDAGVALRTVSPSLGSVPVVRLETSVVTNPRPKGGRSLVLPLSLFAHVVVGASGILASVYATETPLEPKTFSKVFFVAPDFAPPPPPPAPSIRRLEVTRVVERPVSPQLTAPLNIPESFAPESSLDVGTDSGSPTGVEGGVPGGVVGGVVGGLPDAPPPPPQVYRAGTDVREPKKLKSVSPIYPEEARNAGIEGVVVLDCLVSTAGVVTSVTVLRSIPALDRAAIDAVKQWRYTPTLVGGTVVPVLIAVTVNFHLR